ncbi:MAG: hypothetical protein ETSY2_34125 [Candidatus Entotheonella gemina]|uniref:Cytochrome c domain-containing protein n=2 Tax=Candidatus Entotheonella TaxID=93171 RepID=W4LZD9_9BACT|nr:MAG: hypothetical protein ETSY2_34125 [Candidatus Entotheonella gemina]
MCTQCHANLHEHVKTPPGLQVVRDDNTFKGAAIRGFQPEAHPEFAVTFVAKQRHGSALMRLRLNDPQLKDRSRIAFNHEAHLNPEGKVATLIQEQRLRRKTVLTCGACHRVDPGGAYMQPISFEQHCRACHEDELRFAEASPMVPHGDPKGVEAFLCGFYSWDYLQDRTVPGHAPSDRKGVDSNLPRGRVLTPDDIEQLQSDIRLQVGRAHDALFDVGC